MECLGETHRNVSALRLHEFGVAGWKWVLASTLIIATVTKTMVPRTLSCEE